MIDRNLAKNVFLTGFMGAGKSTVGRLLAERLNRPFLDMDQELSRRFKAPVDRIFAEHGEAAFRRAETELLKELLSGGRPQVVAAGGGVVAVRENRGLLAEYGRVFFLDCPFEAAAARLAHGRSGDRPLWPSNEEARRLYQKRRPWYLEAHETITVRKNPNQTADDLARALMPSLRGRLETEGRECLLELAWPESLTRAAELSEGRQKALFLDAALAEQADLWAKAGFLVHSPGLSGENLKTLEQAANLLTCLMNWGLARDDTLVVRGGGSLTDAGAFCAGLYKRGLNLILIATTLLGAVDAAVGGKTALNFRGAKNQIGHFYLPRAVLVDVASFKTLGRAQLAEGLVEAYKTGLIADPELARLIETHLEALLKADLPLLAQVAGRSFQLKAQVVNQDFREEKGLRDVLNLGHTFGHVVESGSDYRISHGRAVAAGLLTAARLSVKKAGLDPAEAARIKAVVEALFPKPDLPDRRRAAEILGHDKKIRSGKPGFILLSQAGRAYLSREVSLEDILTAAYDEAVD